MLHSDRTAPAIEAIAADPARGSIGGFRVTCPACGFTFTTSLRTIATGDARDHVAYMVRRERSAAYHLSVDRYESDTYRVDSCAEERS